MNSYLGGITKYQYEEIYIIYGGLIPLSLVNCSNTYSTSSYYTNPNKNKYLL